jgi:putative flippase GtrA
MNLTKILEHKKFFLYCFCGGVSAVTDLGLFFVLNEIMKIYYIWAIPLSFLLAVIVNYALQRKITFQNTYQKKHKQFTVFLGVMIIGFVINAVITIVQVEAFGVWPTLAKFIAIIICTLYSYYANKNITFKLMK